MDQRPPWPAKQHVVAGAREHAFRALASLLLPASCALACAGPARHVAREAAPPAVIGTMQELNRPAGRDAMKELISSAADGAVAALSDDQRQARIAELSGAVGAQVGGAVARQLRAELAPAVRSASAAATDGVLTQAGSGEGLAQSERLVASLSHAAVGAALQELRSELEPVVRSASSPPEGSPEGQAGGAVHDAVGGLSREASRQIVIGIHEGLSHIERTSKRDEGLRSLVRGPPTSEVLLFIALALAQVIIILAAWLSIIKRRDQRHSRELHDKDGVLLLVSQALRSSRNETWAREIRRALYDAARDKGEVRYVRSLLDDEQPPPVDRVSSPRH